LSETMGVQTHIENFFVAPKNMVWEKKNEQSIAWNPRGPRA
jgi:hypothetical protein